jgi:hypothetical protein
MSDATRDYSETLFLPKTDFPMRAGLPQKRKRSTSPDPRTDYRDA